MVAYCLRYWVNGFVLWVVLFSTAAWLFPSPFQLLKPAIVPGLGIIMFGMGMSLTWGDFARVLQAPRAVLCGLLGQFLFMPLIAWGIAISFQLPPELQLGFILVGCCPGGTASNVIVYLARGNVALSVTMTACSTVAGVVLTPLLTKLLGSQVISIDALALFKSVVLIVLIPVGAGLTIQALFGARLTRAAALFPAVSVLIIALVVAAIVGLSHEKLPQVGGLLFGAVLFHNVAGLLSGYVLAWLFRLSPADRRTVAVEVGMQNSGLGVALATSHFGVLASLPATAFSVIHNLTGSLLAAYWGRKSTGDPSSSE